MPGPLNVAWLRNLPLLSILTQNIFDRTIGVGRFHSRCQNIRMSFFNMNIVGFLRMYYETGLLKV
jgi:hypothetical protein